MIGLRLLTSQLYTVTFHYFLFLLVILRHWISRYRIDVIDGQWIGFVTIGQLVTKSDTVG